MINNRIFEALSCGNVVISDYSDILNETFGEVLQFVRQPEDIDLVLQQLMDPSFADYFEQLRNRGRELILSRHTWSHRVLQIIDFFTSLQGTASSSPTLLQRTRKSEIACNAFHNTPQSNSFIPPVFKSTTTTSGRGGGGIPLLAWVVSDHLASHPDYLLLIRASIQNFFADNYLIHEYSEVEWLAILQEAATYEEYTHRDDTGTNAGDSEEQRECGPDKLSVVAQYSVVLGVMSHLDVLHRGFIAFHQWHRDAYNDEAIVVTPCRDRAAQRLGGQIPSSEILDRTQQKYVAYILGIDVEHSRYNLQRFTAEGRDNRGVYVSELFDMVLFRDGYEKRLVANLEQESYAPLVQQWCCDDCHMNEREGVQLRNSPFQNRTCSFPSSTERMNEFKWQICFGVWEDSVGVDSDQESGDTEVSSSSSLYNVAICLWSQSGFCTARQRARYIPPRVNYTLLLVGGSLSDWTSCCEQDPGRLQEPDIEGDGEGEPSTAPLSCVLDAIPLARVVHVAHGQSKGIVERLQHATELFLIYDDNVPTSILKKGDLKEGSNFHMENCDNSEHNDNIVNTVDEEDRVFNTALHNKNTIHDSIWPLLFGAIFKKSLRLSKQPSAHISDLIEEVAWNRLPVLLQWQRVMSIVVTFGSFKTSGEFVANYINPKHGNDVQNTNPATSAHDMSTSFAEDKLLVYVNFHNFIPGLDGQACFFHDGILSVCRYSRNLYLLDVNLHHLQWSAADLERAAANTASTHITKTTNLRIELRGVLYLQFFYVIEQTYSFCLPNPFYGHNSEANQTLISPWTQCVNGTMNPDFDASLQQKYLESPAGGLAKL